MSNTLCLCIHIACVICGDTCGQCVRHLHCLNLFTVKRWVYCVVTVTLVEDLGSTLHRLGLLASWTEKHDALMMDLQPSPKGFANTVAGNGRVESGGTFSSDATAPRLARDLRLSGELKFEMDKTGKVYFTCCLLLSLPSSVTKDLTEALGSGEQCELHMVCHGGRKRSATCRSQALALSASLQSRLGLKFSTEPRRISCLFFVSGTRHCGLIRTMAARELARPTFNLASPSTLSPMCPKSSAMRGHFEMRWRSNNSRNPQVSSTTRGSFGLLRISLRSPKPVFFIIGLDTDAQQGDESSSEGELTTKDALPDLYDPVLDDKDEAWVVRKRQGRKSDAVLSCPCCFTTLCIDCQR